MHKYLWIVNGDSKAIIKAENEEQALRKVISLCITAQQELEKELKLTESTNPAQDAIWRFNHKDMLVTIDIEEQDAEPYQGDITELL